MHRYTLTKNLASGGIRIKKVLTNHLKRVIIIIVNKREVMVMIREEIETKGLEMTTSLGLEDKKVILFWKAFEEDRLLACRLILKSWELSLRK